MLVSFQTILIHANVRVPFGALRFILATPQFHHWHHGADPEPVDKNFAVHLPVIDWCFGTFHLPGHRWPDRCGVAGDPVPDGDLAQLTLPLRPPAPRATPTLPAG